MSEPLESLGEFGLIDLFQDPTRRMHIWTQQGMGDDCAVLDIGQGQSLLVTTDMLSEGIHFIRDRLTPFQLGWKSMAVNLSDIAAMGGEPQAAFLAMGLSSDLDVDFVKRFRDGFMDCARLFEVDLLGGDTVSTKREVSICVTVLGRASSSRVVYRKGAHVGDRIFLGGRVGDSRAGLQLIIDEEAHASRADRDCLLDAHLQPRPQVELGQLLAERGLAHAMIDVSDGVLQDLSHICSSSHVGADLDANSLPLSDSARRLAKQSGQDVCDWGLSGGEDFCLLFCGPAEKEAQIVQVCRSQLELTIYPIGFIKEGSDLRVKRDGVWQTVGPGGYQHFAES